MKKFIVTMLLIYNTSLIAEDIVSAERNCFEIGNPLVCQELGLYYETKEDHKNARRAYYISCREGFLDGCYKIGVSFYLGFGTKKNFSNASKESKTFLNALSK